MLIRERSKTFLADVDYVSIENANRTRTIIPSTATVPLQVILGLYKQKTGGSENQSRRFKRACQMVCYTTAFFFFRRAAD